MKEKGFVQIPLLVVVMVSITVASIGSSVFLYKQERTPFFTANISEIIYKTFYGRKLEIETLRQETELSKIKEERAIKQAQEEATKRAEEELARKAAEQKAKEEEMARKAAEEKVRQEEAAKITAEEKVRQEAAEREARERELNTDKDGDGLTLRQEMDLGTSDLNKDSDDDGLLDGVDSHPAGGGRDIAQHFEWTSYDGYKYTWDATVHSDWYDFYRNGPRFPHGAVYVTYYDPYIVKIAKKLLDEAEKRGYCKSCFAVDFIHGLPYVKDAVMGYNDYPKFPVETFIERNGDCEDTSYLAASIIIAMGIDVVLVDLPGHMAIGVYGNPNWSGTYYTLNGKRYYYFETTGEDWWFGEIPYEYRNTTATIIEIP